MLSTIRECGMGNQWWIDHHKPKDDLPTTTLQCLQELREKNETVKSNEIVYSGFSIL